MGKGRILLILAEIFKISRKIMFFLPALIIIYLIYNVIRLKKLAEDKELEELNKKVEDSDREKCEKMLKRLITTQKDRDVKLRLKKVIVEEDKKAKSSIYKIKENKIVIGSKGMKTMKTQTIAHECIHATQNPKKLSKYNFITKSLWTVFAILVIVLVILKLTKKLVRNAALLSIVFVVYLLLEYIRVILRNKLEKDAMLRAPELVARYYDKIETLTKQDKKILSDKYKKINSIAVPTYGALMIIGVIVRLLVIFGILAI